MKSFNKIMAGFNNVVDKLEKLSVEKGIEKQERQAEICIIEDHIFDIAAEETAAKNVAAKLKNLFVSTAKS